MEKTENRGGAGRGQGKKKKEGEHLHCKIAADVAAIVNDHVNQGFKKKVDFVEAAIRDYAQKNPNVR